MTLEEFIEAVGEGRRLERVKVQMVMEHAECMYAERGRRAEAQAVRHVMDALYPKQEGKL